MAAAALSRRSAICCSINITSQDNKPLWDSFELWQFERLEALLAHDSNRVAPFAKPQPSKTSFLASATAWPLPAIPAGSRVSGGSLHGELRGRCLRLEARGQFLGSRSGRELFYQNADKVMAVEVKLRPPDRSGPVRPKRCSKRPANMRSRRTRCIPISQARPGTSQGRGATRSGDAGTGRTQLVR